MEVMVKGDIPEISVIMLTYNRENFVQRMIECILAQTFQNFEFIIVDNGSDDKSGIIADSYAQKDNRIKVIHRNRGNIGSGRNAGLDAARGKYIAFVDDDDTCTSDFLEFLYRLVLKYNADIAICGATWADIDEIKVMDAEQALETLLWRKKYNVAFPTKLFRRKMFCKNRFLETGKYDDIYLMPIILSEAKLIVYHGVSKYHFNRHETNNSAWTQNHELLNREILHEYLQVYQDRTNWLIQKFPESSNKWQYFNWSFMVSMVEKITRLELTERYVIRNSLIKELNTNRELFYNSAWILDIEKEWMDRYVVL